MELDKWVAGYKVRAFPWIDGGKHIYVNVQYYAPGQSIEKPPVWDKSILIVNDDDGKKAVFEFTHSLVEHIAQMKTEPPAPAKKPTMKARTKKPTNRGTRG